MRSIHQRSWHTRHYVPNVDDPVLSDGGRVDDASFAMVRRNDDYAKHVVVLLESHCG